MSQEELEQKLTALGDITEDQKKGIVCALIGHSNIQSMCFGYVNCGRCEAQLGDVLVGVYKTNDNQVVIGHNCPICRDNYKRLTWQDKYLVQDPFTVEAEQEADEV